MVSHVHYLLHVSSCPFPVRGPHVICSPSRLAGMNYSDVIHIYGVSRAGFVPQLFSLRLPNPVVVYELLNRAGAEAIIYDPSFSTIVQNPPVPSLSAVSIDQLTVHENQPLPRRRVVASKDDLVFVFHTSGSTSGSPKLVPCRASWVDSMVVKSAEVSQPKNEQRQDVCTWLYVLLSGLYQLYLRRHTNNTFLIQGQHVSHRTDIQ